MLRDGCEARNWPAVSSDDVGRIADDETVRVARN
jgi:hypothetical protein